MRLDFPRIVSHYTFMKHICTLRFMHPLGRSRFMGACVLF